MDLKGSELSSVVFALYLSHRHRRSSTDPSARGAHMHAAPFAQVRQWLDDEWIEQDVHEAIGRRVGGAYEAARADGVDDLGAPPSSCASDGCETVTSSSWFIT